MDAFLAFLDHVHTMLTTTYHNTPIMLMASPQWTRPNCEAIAQYIFEKTRTPALCLIHSAVATQYGLKYPNMTVVDIGFEKVDVTAIHDGRVVNHLDVGAPPVPDRRISGGEVFTQRLLKLLEGQGFTREMAEQLKRSPICEVLPYAPAEKLLAELPEKDVPVVPAPADPVADAAAATTAPEASTEPSKPSDTDTDKGESWEKGVEEDGVLDVAKIVTSGQTKEFLAKKEKEKVKPGRKPKDGEAAPARPVRLPNSKRTRNTFVFEEVVQEEVVPEPKVAPATNGSVENQPPASDAMQVDTEGSGEKTETETAKPAEPATAESTESKPEGEKPEGQPEADPEKAAPEAPSEQPKPEGQTEAQPEAQAEAKSDESKPSDTPELRAKRIRRDIEVGIERFTFADREEIDRIVDAIYHTIQGIDDMYMRPACWDNLVFVGNGARLRGLKENILQTLNARHLVSPSTATMFTSELPSNMATPTGTGSQTPTGSFTGAPHQLPSSGVNPLLQAATTANSLGVAAGGGAASTGAGGTPQAGSEAGGPSAATHHFHSQTPTSIKTVGMPTYLQEWTKNGFEEAMFLGAQVAARIVFCLHSNMDAQSIEAQRLASLNRVDYK
jgi:actin-related protein 9